MSIQLRIDSILKPWIKNNKKHLNIFSILTIYLDTMVINILLFQLSIDRHGVNWIKCQYTH